MADENRQAPVSPPAMKRGVRVLLFVSLALNILVVGALAGAVMRSDGPIGGREEMRRAQDAGIGPFGHALTREQRRALAADIEGRARMLQDNRGEIRALFGDMLSLIRSEPFDADGFRAHLEEAQSRLIARQRIGVDALIAQLQAMDQGERGAFADRLEHSFRKLRPGR